MSTIDTPKTDEVERDLPSRVKALAFARTLERQNRELADRVEELEKDLTQLEQIADKTLNMFECDLDDEGKHSHSCGHCQAYNQLYKFKHRAALTKADL